MNKQVKKSSTKNNVIKAKNTKAKKKMSKKFVITKLIFLFVLLIIESFVGSIIVTSGYLPTKYNIVLIIVLLFLFLLLGFLTILKKKTLNIIVMIFMLIISTGLVFGGIYYSNVIGTVKNLVTSDKEEEINYVFIVKSNSKLKIISELEKKKIGVFASEVDSVTKKITEEIKGTVETYDNIGDMILGLQLNTVDALMVNNDIYELILEQFEDFNTFARKLTDEVKVKTKNKKIESSIDVNKNDSFIVYISGVDNRDTSSIGTTGLSDVNILAAINKKAHKILLVSIPRDYYVRLRGTNGLKDKLTHAGLYGINKSIGTIEDLFNVKINAYAKFNFKAVTTLVDKIGGITVYSDTSFNSSHLSGWYVKKGNNTLNGAKALAYARERYAYASGDRHRGKNQEAIITAIIKKITTNKKYLLEFTDIMNAIDPYFSTNIKEDIIKSLVRDQLDTMPSWKVESISVDGTNSENKTYSWPNQTTYVMIPNQNTINTAKNKMYEVLRAK